jgi:hypothetical protein
MMKSTALPPAPLNSTTITRAAAPMLTPLCEPALLPARARHKCIMRISVDDRPYSMATIIFILPKELDVLASQG